MGYARVQRKNPARLAAKCKAIRRDPFLRGGLIGNYFRFVFLFFLFTLFVKGEGSRVHRERAAAINNGSLLW